MGQTNMEWKKGKGNEIMAKAESGTVGGMENLRQERKSACGEEEEGNRKSGM